MVGIGQEDIGDLHDNGGPLVPLDGDEDKVIIGGSGPNQEHVTLQ